MTNTGILNLVTIAVLSMLFFWKLFSERKMIISKGTVAWNILQLKLFLLLAAIPATYIVNLTINHNPVLVPNSELGIPGKIFFVLIFNAVPIFYVQLFFIGLNAFIVLIKNRNNPTIVT